MHWKKYLMNRRMPLFHWAVWLVQFNVLFFYVFVVKAAHTTTHSSPSLGILQLYVYRSVRLELLVFHNTVRCLGDTRNTSKSHLSLHLYEAAIDVWVWSHLSGESPTCGGNALEYIGSCLSANKAKEASLLQNAWITFLASSEVLQRPSNKPFVWFWCLGEGMHLKLKLRTGVIPRFNWAVQFGMLFVCFQW